MVLVYVAMMLTILLAFCAFSVDVSKARVVKTELQRTADAAARYAASGLATSVAEARARAITSAAENTANGTPVVLTNADIEFGSWNPDTKTFTVLTGSAEAGATAVRVTARRVASRGTAVTASLGGAFNSSMRNLDVQASATVSRGQVISADVEADSCPWLAGMPKKSKVEGYDGNDTDAKAPAQSPYEVKNLPLIAGTKMSFRQAGGQTSYDGAGDFGPDGNTDWIVRQRAANGINATSAPLNSFVGIFLDDRDPDDYSQAAELDFTTPASRNFQTLSPGLKQVFFIGDGLDSSGKLQQFVVPSGATRFYLGIMDEKGWWWDNTGSLQTTMLDATITTVR